MQNNLKAINEIKEEWSKHINKITVGIDDWVEFYKETLQGKEIYIQSDDDVVSLMIEHDLSAKQTGLILACAWELGRVDIEYHHTPSPKQAIPMGISRSLHLIMQKHIAKKEIDGQEVKYKKFVGPPAYKSNQEIDQDKDVTHMDYENDTQFYVLSDTKKGVEYTRAYLKGRIVTEIRNRLTVLKAAGEDYKAEGKQLVKTINAIIKELNTVKES